MPLLSPPAQEGFSLRLWRFIFNYELCPIVYHVYEELKRELCDLAYFEEDDFFND